MCIHLPCKVVLRVSACLFFYSFYVHLYISGKIYMSICYSLYIHLSSKIIFLICISDSIIAIDNGSNFFFFFFGLLLLLYVHGWQVSRSTLLFLFGVIRSECFRLHLLFIPFTCIDHFKIQHRFVRINIRPCH